MSTITTALSCVANRFQFAQTIISSSRVIGLCLLFGNAACHCEGTLFQNYDDRNNHFILPSDYLKSELIRLFRRSFELP